MILALVFWAAGWMFACGLQEKDNAPLPVIFLFMVIWPMVVGEFVRDLFELDEPVAPTEDKVHPS